MRQAVPLLLVVTLCVLAAGCAQPAADAPPATAIAALDHALGPLPAMAKAKGEARQAQLVPLAQPTPLATFDIAAADSTVQLAFDLVGGPENIHLRIQSQGGGDHNVERNAPQGSGSQVKQVVVLEHVAAGTMTVSATSTSAWKVGVVATQFAPGALVGARLQVAFPEQTQIDHSFVPARLEAAAHEPLRITLYDFDPHAGIENLQHDLTFEGLGLRTQGRTTWGEVRVLDLPALPPGEYAFKCSYHGFTGSLSVS